MRRFELVDGTSSKFWEIDVQGAAQTVRYGRIGSDGQQKTKDFPSPAAAQAAADKLVAEKTKGGYQEVTLDGAVSAKAQAAALPSAAPKPVASKPVASPPAVSPAPSSAKNASTAEVAATRTSERALSEATLRALRALALPTRSRPEGSVDHLPYLHVHPFDGVNFEERALAFANGTGKGQYAVFLREFVKLDDARAAAVRAVLEKRFAEALETWEGQGTAAGVCAFILQDDERIVGALFERAMTASVWPANPVPAALNGLSDATKVAAFIDKMMADPNYMCRFALNHLDPVTLLLRCGLPVVPSLVRLADREFEGRGVDAYADAAQDRVLLALAHAATPEAVRYLLGRGEERVVFSLLTIAAEANPHDVLAACLELLARSPTHVLAADLAGRMLRGEPKWLELARTENQRVIAAGLMGPTVSKPSASNLPSCLTSEPWKGLEPLSRPQVPGLSAPPSEESLEWPDGLAASWAAPGGVDETYWLRIHFDAEFNKTHHAALQSKAGRDPLMEQLVAHVGDGSELDPVALYVRCLGQLTGWRLEDRKRSGPIWLSQTDARISIPMWKAVHPAHWTISSETARVLVAAFGLAALDTLLVRAGFAAAPTGVFGQGKESGLGPLLEAALPIASARLARPIAVGLSGRQGRKAARRWVLAHPTLAASALVPIALSAPRDKQDAAPDGAVVGLQTLAREGHRALVEEAASAQGEAALKAVTQILDASPYALKKAPSLPKWLALARLAPVVTNEGQPIGDAATRILLGMLVASTDDGAYPALEEVQAHCTSASLDAFAWSLFREWVWADAPSKDKWALSALGWIGDERVCRNLANLMLRWPSDGLSARAKEGVEVLARIGSEPALMALYQFSERAKTNALKTAATEKVQAIAEGLDMTTDELGDRLVPDLGLDASGTLALEVGTDDAPLTLRVALDANLTPCLKDGSGAALAKFPSASGPYKGADKGKLKDANAAYKALAKDAKAVAAHALARLESAMVRQRSWPLSVARRCFFSHPVMRSAAAAVLWTSDAGPFRVAEDGTLADLNDETLTLDADAKVRVYHPAAVDAATRTTFQTLFADYKLLQPFGQVARPVFGPGDIDVASWTGRQVASRKLYALEAYGWSRDTNEASKKLNVRGTARLTYTPGLEGGPDASPTQSLRVFELDVDPSTLDPIDVSELVHDMRRICAEG